MQSFYSKCPAKINLFLKLTGKSNAFHELESLFAFLDLHDELRVEKSDKFNLEISGEFSLAIDFKNNLFVKILDYFASEFGISKNLNIKIVKNIPVSAGLGGGSSNAAAFLHALNQIFSLGLSLSELQKISLKFGSDIAFLLQNKSAIIRGRGEIIENFPDFKPIPILLINPKIEVSTKEVFAKFNGNFSAKTPQKILLKKDVFDLAKNMPNDLQKPATELLPIILKILENLQNCQAEIAKMSGSGASCFGVFFDEEKLNLAEEFFTKNHPTFFVKKTNICSGFYND